MGKNIAHLVTFHESILVCLWTFQPTHLMKLVGEKNFGDIFQTFSFFIYIYIYIYIYMIFIISILELCIYIYIYIWYLIYLFKVIYNRTLAWRLECPPMAQKTRVQSQVESYQRLRKWYLMPSCLTLSTVRYGSRMKWSNPRKWVVPTPTLWCSSYRKRSLRVTLD